MKNKIMRRGLAGQAMTELTVFGSLLLLMFTILISYGLNYLNQSRADSDAYIAALGAASARTGDGGTVFPDGIGGVYTGHGHTVDATDPYGFNPAVFYQSSASAVSSYALMRTPGYGDSLNLPKVYYMFDGRPFFFSTGGFRTIPEWGSLTNLWPQIISVKVDDNDDSYPPPNGDGKYWYWKNFDLNTIFMMEFVTLDGQQPGDETMGLGLFNKGVIERGGIVAERHVDFGMWQLKADLNGDGDGEVISSIRINKLTTTEGLDTEMYEDVEVNLLEIVAREHYYDEEDMPDFLKPLWYAYRFWIWCTCDGGLFAPCLPPSQAIGYHTIGALRIIDPHRGALDLTIDNPNLMNGLVFDAENEQDVGSLLAPTYIQRQETPHGIKVDHGTYTQNFVTRWIRLNPEYVKGALVLDLDGDGTTDAPVIRKDFDGDGQREPYVKVTSLYAAGTDYNQDSGWDTVWDPVEECLSCKTDLECRDYFGSSRWGCEDGCCVKLYSPEDEDEEDEEDEVIDDDGGWTDTGEDDSESHPHAGSGLGDDYYSGYEGDKDQDWPATIPSW